jgi:hypothetical protein
MTSTLLISIPFNGFSHIINQEEINNLPEPQKSFFEAAYQAGLYETVYEDSIPESLLNWQGFLDACDVPELGGNGVFQALLGINFPLAMDSYQIMLRLLSGLGASQEIRTLNFLYSILVSQLSSELVNKLQEAITKNNIPINIF